VGQRGLTANSRESGARTGFGASTWRARSRILEAMRFLVLALLVLAVPALAACPECPANPDPKAERDRHDLVLVGTVYAARDSILPRPPGPPTAPPPVARLIGVHVHGTWRGLPSRDLLLLLDPCAARKIDPAPGEFWVLYADSTDTGVTVPACTRSALRTAANADYEALGQPASLLLPRRARRPGR
jgi:hypothetical protein